MTAQEITNELEDIASTADFEQQTVSITAHWATSGVGVEVVDPVLRFMEDHPRIDYGPPGPLVHFMERFCDSGYEERVVESIRRKPTAHTVWLLNRLINGAKETGEKQRLIGIMEEAKLNPLTDQDTLVAINEFLAD